MTTAWEIALYRDGVRVTPLGYSVRKTRGALLRVVADNKPAILAQCTEADLDADLIANRDKIAFGAVSVAWTGRTKNDVDRAK